MQQIESPSESLATQTDPDLLSQFLSSKDELAFTELIRRHSGLVMRICRLFLKETSDQEDAFQATFLVLAKSANRIRKRSSLSSWLHGVAYRTARRAAQDMRKRQKIVQSETLKIMEAPMIDLSPFEKMQSEYEEQILHEEVQQLSQKYREPVVRRYFEGQSVPEIATELKVSVGVIEGRLKRAKSELGARLIRRGINATGFFIVTATLASTSTASAAVSTTLSTQTATLATQSLSSSATTLASATVANLASKEIAMITSAKIGTMLACLILPAAALLTPAFLPMDSGAGVNLPISTLAAFAGESPKDTVGGSGFSSKKKKSKKSSDNDPFGSVEETNEEFGIPVAGVAYNVKQRTPDAKRNANSNSGDYLNRSAARVKIEKALSESLSFDFRFVPLDDVVGVLSAETGIPIIIDYKSLEGQGFEDDHLKFGLVLKSTTLQNGLDLILPDHDLDYIIKNDVLMIVSQEDAESFHETRIYDVSKFIPESSNLPDLITETVKPDSWNGVGGEGTIFEMPGALVVRNNQRAHSAIAEVLEQLKKHSEKSRTMPRPIKVEDSAGDFGGDSGFFFKEIKKSKPKSMDPFADTGMGSSGMMGMEEKKKESELEPEVEKELLDNELQSAMREYEVLKEKSKNKTLSEIEENRLKRVINRIDDLEEESYQFEKRMRYKKRQKKLKENDSSKKPRAFGGFP